MSAPDTIHAIALGILDRLAIVGGADAILRQAIRTPRPLPANVDRCPGEGSWVDGEFHWREGCDDCQRRTSPGGRVTVEPPKIITFECHLRIGPEEVVE